MNIIIPNENNLQKARKYFRENTKPNSNALPKIAIIISGSSQKFGGAYNRYYLPLEGLEFINKIPENYKVHCFASPKNGDKKDLKTLYCFWDLTQKFLEIANVTIQGTRPDSSLNQDKREWTFDTQGVQRAILFPGDPYIYFENEKYNGEMGKYYNKAFCEQFRKGLQIMNIRGKTSTLEDINQFLKFSGKEEITALWRFERAYKQLQERTVSETTKAKELHFQKIKEAIKDFGEIEQKVKFITTHNKPFGNYSFYKACISFIIETIDDCIVIRKIQPKSFYTGMPNKSIVNEVYESNIKTHESKRLYFTPDGIKAEEYHPYYKRWIKCPVMEFPNIYTVEIGEIAQKDLLDIPKFEKWKGIINKPEYTNTFKIGLIIQLEKHPLAKWLYDNGLFGIVEYATMCNKDLLTIMNNIFHTTTASERYEKYTSLSLDKAKKMLLSCLETTKIKAPEISEGKFREIEYYFRYETFTLLRQINEEVDIDTLKKEEYETIISNLTSLQDWYIHRSLILYDTQFDPTVSIEKIIPLLKRENKIFMQLSKLIYAANTAYPKSTKEKLLALDLYNPDKINENKAEFTKLGVKI